MLIVLTSFIHIILLIVYVNVDPKYIKVIKQNREARKLEMHNYNFERVASFKYLGVYKKK